MLSCEREPYIDKATSQRPLISADADLDIDALTSLQTWNGMLLFESEANFHDCQDEMEQLDAMIRAYVASLNSTYWDEVSITGVDPALETAVAIYDPDGYFGGVNPFTGTMLPNPTTIDVRLLDLEPAFFMFELSKGFVSLRQHLATSQLALIDEDMLDPAEDNPDNFYLADEYTSGFLNPNLEIRIGNSVYKSISAISMAEVTDASETSLSAIRKAFPTNIDWQHRKEYPSAYVLTKLAQINQMSNVAAHWTGDPLDVEACAASFSFTVSSTNGLNYSFTNTSTSTSSSPTYSWNFGDGTAPSTLTNPTHNYATSGTYVVTLSVFEPGSTIPCDIASSTISVSSTNCSANFTFTTTPTGEVTFTNTSTSAPGDPITSYSWTFGDASSGTGANPMHTYSTNGWYNVCLTIHTSNGCEATTCKDVQINLVCCKARDVNGERISGNFRLRGWLNMQNIPYDRKIIAKTRSYRRTANGNGWTNTSCSSISAGESGTVFSRTCAESFGIAPPIDTRSNDNNARSATPGSFNGPMRAQFGSIASTHVGTRQGTTLSFVLTLLNGTQCD